MLLNLPCETSCLIWFLLAFILGRVINFDEKHKINANGIHKYTLFNHDIPYRK